MDILTPIIEAGRSEIEKYLTSTMFPNFSETYKKIQKAEEDGISKKLVPGTADKIKGEMTAAVKNMTDGLISKIKELAPNLALLTAGAASLITQFGSSAMAIIGTCPVGPTVNATLLPDLIQKMKSQGDSLSKIFDDVTAKVDEIKKLGGDKIDIINKNVLNPAEGILSTVKAACLMVGAPCGGTDAILPKIDPPIEVPELDPNDCKNYSGSQSEGERTAAGCSAYEEMIEGKERSCNNCKRFKK